mmetsp:Transcript_5514/g.11582  ORF Transcript_5514/g.11582 Transcript_5514/m.11582 type:complete len:348 (+) Transcript_5514:54-1097(+)
MAATFDPTFLFNKPTFCGTYFHAFKIFFAHWQTFMGLGLLLILVTAVIWIVFVVIQKNNGYPTFMALATSPFANSPILRAIYYYVIYSYTSYDPLMDTDDYWNNYVDISSVMTALTLFFLAMVLCLAATSTFTGSLIRATAEAYAGASPEFRPSLRYGWNVKWKIFCSSFLLFLGGFIFYLVIFLLTRNLIRPWLLAIAIFVIIMGMVSSMIGAMPSIVLENVSATGAFKRSWNLCKSSTCEIFCKLVVFSIGMEVIPQVISLIIMRPTYNTAHSRTGIIIDSIFSVLISGFYVVMTIVLSVVIYMGIRIVKEELTQVSFNQELALPAPDNQVNEVEASNEPIEYSV